MRNPDSNKKRGSKCKCGTKIEIYTLQTTFPWGSVAFFTMPLSGYCLQAFATLADIWVMYFLSLASKLNCEINSCDISRADIGVLERRRTDNTALVSLLSAKEGLPLLAWQSSIQIVIITQYGQCPIHCVDIVLDLGNAISKPFRFTEQLYPLMQQAWYCMVIIRML